MVPPTASASWRASRVASWKRTVRALALVVVFMPLVYSRSVPANSAMVLVIAGWPKLARRWPRPALGQRDRASTRSQEESARAPVVLDMTRVTTSACREITLAAVVTAVAMVAIIAAAVLSG